MNRGADRVKASAVIGGDIPALVRLLSSPSGMTRLHAREALVAAGDAAMDALIEALKDERDVVRWEAAKALVSLPKPRAAPALVATLEDEEFDIRWLAAEALIALGTEGLGAVLEALEEHAGSVWLREGAYHVLRHISDGTNENVVLPVLAALEHYDPEVVVPFAATDALEKLKRKSTQSGRGKEERR